MVRRQFITRTARIREQSGLTLIELLVVMGVMALAATIVLLNAPPRQSAARAAAADFADALITAQDNAVVAGGAYRLEITPAGWHIARLDEREWTDYRRGGDEDIRLKVDIEDAAESNIQALTGERPERSERRGRDAPILIPIDPFGDAPIFELRFDDDRESWIVRHDAAGAVRTARP